MNTFLGDADITTLVSFEPATIGPSGDSRDFILSNGQEFEIVGLGIPRSLCAFVVVAKLIVQRSSGETIVLLEGRFAGEFFDSHLPPPRWKLGPVAVTSGDSVRCRVRNVSQQYVDLAPVLYVHMIPELRS